jgi:hypothetical protein
MIMTPSGQTPIEELTIGDRVLTYKHSIRTIKEIIEHRIINNGDSLRTTIYEHGNGLRLTGEHCVLVENPSNDLLELTKDTIGRNSVIDGMSLIPVCLLREFTRFVDDGEYRVYNMTLGGGDPVQAYGVYANGVLCETLSQARFRSEFGKYTDDDNLENP